MDSNQIQNFSAAMAGMMGIIVLIVLVSGAFTIFLFWRIFRKAGLPGSLALLLLLGPIGMFINACVLAFAQWKVVPVAAAAPYYPPAYPPAPQIQP